MNVHIRTKPITNETVLCIDKGEATLVLTIPEVERLKLLLDIDWELGIIGSIKTDACEPVKAVVKEKPDLCTQDAILDHLESLKKVIDRLLPKPTVINYDEPNPCQWTSSEMKDVLKENK